MLERRHQNLLHTEITMPAFTLFVARSTSNQPQSMSKHQSASKLSLSLSASVLLLTSLMSLTVHAEDTISIDTSTAPSAKVQETKRMVIVRPSLNNTQNIPQFPSQNQSQPLTVQAFRMAPQIVRRRTAMPPSIIRSRFSMAVPIA